MSWTLAHDNIRQRLEELHAVRSLYKAAVREICTIMHGGETYDAAVQDVITVRLGFVSSSQRSSSRRAPLRRQQSRSAKRPTRRSRTSPLEWLDVYTGIAVSHQLSNARTVGNLSTKHIEVGKFSPTDAKSFVGKRNFSNTTCAGYAGRAAMKLTLPNNMQSCITVLPSDQHSSRLSKHFTSSRCTRVHQHFVCARLIIPSRRLARFGTTPVTSTTGCRSVWQVCQTSTKDLARSSLT